MARLQKMLVMGFVSLVVAGVMAYGADAPRLKKEKLQIILCFGQSNMVGLSDVKTAWYLTQPQWVPPRDIMLQKSEIFDWNSLYWQGVGAFEGPQELKAELMKLLDDRRASRDKWRKRAKGDNWNEAEWGPKPEIKGRESMYAFLDKKAIEEGIYKRMAEILDGPENRMPVDKAYEKMIARDKFNAEHIARVREIFLNGTTGEAFNAFEAEVNAVTAAKKEARKKAGKTPPVIGRPEAEAERAAYAQLALKHLNMPIAKRTYLSGFGAIAGSKGEGITSGTSGPLSVGYGADINHIGPEYGVGISLERLVDAPILLVKCAWGNTTLKEAWRPGSLDGVETPTEKAVREEWNRQEQEAAKSEGREPVLRQAPSPTGKLSWAWNMALPHVKKVLADPGQFYPGYDPETGYEVAGMVWFQGYSDAGNKAYGEQLVEMIKWLRKEINAPDMKVVCGTMGVNGKYAAPVSGDVNAGMVYASRVPELKGTVDVVNTCRYFPQELGQIGTVMQSCEKGSAESIVLSNLSRRAVSNKAYHYFGSAKFFLLTGDAMGRSLANLMAGGEPTVHTEILVDQSSDASEASDE